MENSIAIIKNEFKKIPYSDGKAIYFHSPKHSFHEYFGHKRRIKSFPFYKNLLLFLNENENLEVYFTLDDLGAPFLRFGNEVLVNMHAYQTFCKEIESKTQGRALAFFGKHLSMQDIFSKEEKDKFVKDNTTEQTILEALDSMTPAEKSKIAEKLDGSSPEGNTSSTSYDVNDLVVALRSFSEKDEVAAAAFSALPSIQLETLKKNLDFIRGAGEKSEDDIQQWIDEDSGKFRKQRCLIFGIEFVDPKREGELSRKKFDILAEQDRQHHVIIELKGPNAEIFEIVEKANSNGGVSSEYNISPELARAIPQVLGYKKLYEKMTSEELEKLGLKESKKISKCIIVIGRRKDNPVWLENFEDFKNSLTGIEVWTYTDLEEKMENTIKNLSENL